MAGVYFGCSYTARGGSLHGTGWPSYLACSPWWDLALLFWVQSLLFLNTRQHQCSSVELIQDWTSQCLIPQLQSPSAPLKPDESTHGHTLTVVMVQDGFPPWSLKVSDNILSISSCVPLFPTIIFWSFGDVPFFFTVSQPFSDFSLHVRCYALLFHQNRSCHSIYNPHITKSKDQFSVMTLLDILPFATVITLFEKTFCSLSQSLFLLLPSSLWLFHLLKPSWIGLMSL